MFGLPAIVGLQRAYARWREAGHEKMHKEIYPGM
jgi:hypothetical protein